MGQHTSSINCLTDDVNSAALIAGLSSGFHIRLTFTSVSEIIATTLGDRRRRLLRVCRQLLASGDCIGPQNDILIKLISRFEASPVPFNWAEVSVRLQEAELEISREENFNDDLSKEERGFARANEAVFARVYSDAKPHFDKLFADGVESVPVTLAELVTRLQTGGVFWTLASNLYARVAKTPPDDSTIRRFFAECAPFRVLMVALCAAQYDRCIKMPGAGPSLRAGRNDTFMAICLPYCNQFVTHDRGQFACFGEVASFCTLGVTIRSYDEFRDSFSILAAVADSAAC